MRHLVKINNNKSRSFCYYNFEGKRVRIYNGKRFNINIFPNKEKYIEKRKILLNQLKDVIQFDLNKTSVAKKTNVDNLYDQSIFKERIPIYLYEHPNDGSKAVATEIANLIKKKQSENKNCVLGLATGSSPISVYRELIKMHKEENLSFHNVITFNLDEYVPMNPNSKNSYIKTIVFI